MRVHSSKSLPRSETCPQFNCLVRFERDACVRCPATWQPEDRMRVCLSCVEVYASRSRHVSTVTLNFQRVTEGGKYPHKTPVGAEVANGHKFSLSVLRCEGHLSDMLTTLSSKHPSRRIENTTLILAQIADFFHQISFQYYQGFCLARCINPFRRDIRRLLIFPARKRSSMIARASVIEVWLRRSHSRACRPDAGARGRQPC